MSLQDTRHIFTATAETRPWQVEVGPVPCACSWSAHAVSTTDRAQLSSQQCSQLSSDALGDFCSQPQLGAISSSGPYCYLFSVSGTVVRAFRRFNLRAKCSRAKCSRSCSWFLRWLRGARPTGFRSELPIRMHAKTLRLVDPYLHLWTAFSTWLY